MSLTRNVLGAGVVTTLALVSCEDFADYARPHCRASPSVCDAGPVAFAGRDGALDSMTTTGRGHGGSLADLGIPGHGLAGQIVSVEGDAAGLGAAGGRASVEVDASVGRDGAVDRDASVAPGDSEATTSEPLEPGALWPIPAGAPFTMIPVCFTTGPHREWDDVTRCPRQLDGKHDCDGADFTGTTTAALRWRLQALLEDTWQRASQIEFRSLRSDLGRSDFQDCPDSPLPSGTIEVTFVGRDSGGASRTRVVTGSGVHANYPTDVHVDWQAIRDGDPAGLRLVLREFGHALGLPYEWLRKDESGASLPCEGFTRDPALDWVTSPAGLRDEASVMNRCGVDTTEVAALSTGDIVAIQAAGIYGRKPPGYLIGYRGRCLDIPARRTDPRTPIVATACDYNAQYFWSRVANPGAGSFFTWVGPDTDQPRCLDANSGLRTDEKWIPVVSNVWTGADSQQFPMMNLAWKMGSLCVALADAGTSLLELRSCDGSLAQQWNFWSNDSTMVWGQIQSVLTGTCLAMDGAGDAGAAPPVASSDGGTRQLVMRECMTSDRTQSFLPDYYGKLLLPDRSGYIEVQEGGLRPGAALTMGDGTSYRAQFTVSGHLKALNRCLSMQGGLGDPGALIGLEPCAAKALAQEFEFYW